MCAACRKSPRKEGSTERKLNPWIEDSSFLDFYPDFCNATMASCRRDFQQAQPNRLPARHSSTRHCKRNDSDATVAMSIRRQKTIVRWTGLMLSYYERMLDCLSFTVTWIPCWGVHCRWKDGKWRDMQCEMFHDGLDSFSVTGLSWGYGVIP